jgi:hypothetical protein
MARILGSGTGEDLVSLFATPAILRPRKVCARPYAGDSNSD